MTSRTIGVLAVMCLGFALLPFMAQAETEEPVLPKAYDAAIGDPVALVDADLVAYPFDPWFAAQ